ncbi:MAG: DUF3488 domain-containing protein [Proteobacteria bacterium]|nr:DUF3488 domain-containing protein [Pseudomonadota bacterium]
MPPVITPGSPPQRRAVLWTCAAFAGGVLLHADRLPPWAVAVALALLTWRALTAGHTRAVPLPVRALLAALLAAVVLLRFRTWNGLTAGSTLLMLMAALKLTELRSARDLLVIVAAATFLLLSACLDRQDLPRVPLYALQAWLCCATLAVISASAMRARTALALAARSLLYALPLALALFLFFPRLQGAFWAIPRGGAALTGLSDSMTPGGIGELIAQYDIAFRVSFPAAVPPPQERYWRGPVLHLFDGRTWRVAPTVAAVAAPAAPDREATPYPQHIVEEPSERRWAFALDTPVRSAGTQLTTDSQLLATAPLTAATAFDVLSYTRVRSARPPSPLERRIDMSLPADANPRSRALALALRQHAADDSAFALALLEYFRRGGFQYTLTPGTLGMDSVDDFLFRSREGFCGHYASAFAALLRAAGVPARVVTGYLGGEWNPVGRFFVVRQSDAHAWVEAWLPARGWTRFDPTAAVEPERLRRGVLDLLPQGLSVSERLWRRSPWLLHLLQRWEAANAWWTDRVVRYDYASQLDLLARLGVRSPDVAWLGWAVAAGLALWLGALAWWLGREPRPLRASALPRAYRRLCRKLAARGVARQDTEGPLAYAARLAAQQPVLAAGGGAQLLQRYAQLRYGPPGTRHAQEVGDFARAVARLP